MSKVKTNSTGSMSRDFIWTPEDDEQQVFTTLLYSYNTVVGYVQKNKRPVICSGPYSATTSKHLSKYREEFGIDKEDTYEYAAFLKRAELDGVNVQGGWN